LTHRAIPLDGDRRLEADLDVRLDPKQALEHAVQTAERIG